MKFLPPEPTVNLYKEGFDEADIIQRKKVGAALSDLLNRIDDPIVVALEGKWGTGKTYFLKRWVGAHQMDDSCSTTMVYFDAFAHDYLGDPLPALVSALEDRLPKSRDRQIKNAKKAAFKLAKPLARVGLAVATYGASEVLNDMGDSVAGAIGGEATAGLEKYWAEEKNRRTAMSEFKQAIELLASSNVGESPGASIVVVVDELDRCRPDYALEVLEVIKHFFSVPHLHFVLGVNLQALENSVRARYGENIDAQSYLKKFIQITLELPNQFGSEHDRKQGSIAYLEYLINEMGVPPHIGKRLLTQVEMVSRFNDISMRDIGKIVSSATLANSEVLKKDNWKAVWIDVMVDLIIVKVVRSDLYPKFLNANVSATDLETYLGATERVINRGEIGEHNPDYDHKIRWKYHTWLYLSQDGTLELEDTKFAKVIGQQFDTFGLQGEARSFPMKVHRKWLDQFTFYVK